MKNLIQNAEIVIATCLRVPTSEREENLFYYDVRSDDECQGIPCEVSNFVMVNHLATIATNKELYIAPEGYFLSEEEQRTVENALYGS